jgi:hypothetical protein
VSLLSSSARNIQYCGFRAWARIETVHWDTKVLYGTKTWDLYLLWGQLLESWPATLPSVRELDPRWINDEYSIGHPDHEYGVARGVSTMQRG